MKIRSHGKFSNLKKIRIGQEVRSNGTNDHIFCQNGKFLQNGKLSMRTNFNASALIFDSEKSSRCILSDGKVFYPN